MLLVRQSRTRRCPALNPYNFLRRVTFATTFLSAAWRSSRSVFYFIGRIFLCKKIPVLKKDGENSRVTTFVYRRLTPAVSAGTAAQWPSYPDGITCVSHVAAYQSHSPSVRSSGMYSQSAMRAPLILRLLSVRSFSPATCSLPCLLLKCNCPGRLAVPNGYVHASVVSSL